MAAAAGRVLRGRREVGANQEVHKQVIHRRVRQGCDVGNGACRGRDRERQGQARLGRAGMQHGPHRQARTPCRPPLVRESVQLCWAAGGRTAGGVHALQRLGHVDSGLGCDDDADLGEVEERDRQQGIRRRDRLGMAALATTHLEHLLLSICGGT